MSELRIPDAGVQTVVQMMRLFVPRVDRETHQKKGFSFGKDAANGMRRSGQLHTDFVDREEEPAFGLRPFRCGSG